MKTAAEWEKQIWESKAFGAELITAIQCDALESACTVIEKTMHLMDDEQRDEHFMILGLKAAILNIRGNLL